MQFTKGNYLSGGGVSVSKVAFDYSESGLDLGISFYGPQSGELLLDAWIEVDTAFDGTTPTGDIGTTFPGGSGFFGVASGKQVDLTKADVFDLTGTLLSNNNQWSLAGAVIYEDCYRTPIPGRFLTTDALRLVVSIDGKLPGAESTLSVTPPAFPFTIVAGVSDNLAFVGAPRGGAAPIQLVLPPGVMADIDAATAALQTAFTNAAVPVLCTNDGTSIHITYLSGGAINNGNLLGPGVNDAGAFYGVGDSLAFGLGTGGATGATQGSGIVYVVTALAN